VAVGVRTTDSSLLGPLAERCPPGSRIGPVPMLDEVFSFVVGGSHGRLKRYHLVYEGGTQRARTLELAQALEQFEVGLRVCVASRARRRVFLHAGVVGWEGRAIVLPGRSHAGKSTLVAALVRAGAEYGSDEYAVLDHRGRVHPYPRPLGLRDDAELGSGSFAADMLGGRLMQRSLPVGLVAVTEYRPRARFRPRPLSAGRAVLELTSRSFSARLRPGPVLAALHRAVGSARLLAGPRGEAADAAAALLAAAGRSD
jgi:hypothetical protein